MTRTYAPRVRFRPGPAAKRSGVAGYLHHFHFHKRFTAQTIADHMNIVCSRFLWSVGKVRYWLWRIWRRRPHGARRGRRGPHCGPLPPLGRPRHRSVWDALWGLTEAESQVYIALSEHGP